MHNVFFSLGASNTDKFDHVRVKDQGSSFSLAWEDLFGGGDKDFNDLVLNMQLTNTTGPIGARLQGQRQGEIIDLRDFSGQFSANLTFNATSSNKDFVGFYKVNNTQGTVTDPLTGKTLTPGEVGYAQAAIRQSVFSLNDGTSPKMVEGGGLLVPFIIANGNVEQFLSQNNQPGTGIQAYFPYLKANADNLEHIRLLGDNTFAFENSFNSANPDFNDMVFKVDFSVISQQKDNTGGNQQPTNPGTLAFSAASYSEVEGNSGTVDKVVAKIQRTGGSDGAVSVQLLLDDGTTGTANDDYTNNLPMTVNFASGEMSKDVVIPILGDTIFEADEIIKLKLLSATGGASLGSGQTATYTIKNDDAAPIFDFSAATYSVTEGNTAGFTQNAEVTVKRTNNTTGKDTVVLQLANGAISGATGGGTADAGIDYNNSPITVTFNPGDTSKTVSILVAGDTEYEQNENVALTLVNPSSGSIGTTQPSAVLTINNDDDAPPLVTQIRGIKWNDLDGDRTLDVAEPGLSGWTIYLDQNQNSKLDAGELSTTTDASGNYIFTGLSAGTYTVAEVPQKSWRQTFPGITPGSGTAGNILVSTNNTIGEYTQAGAAVSGAITPPPSDNDARDLIVDNSGSGLIHTKNGTFTPLMSTYNPSTTTWTNKNYPGWSTVNNVSYGGIASYQNYVYATDMLTYSGGEQKGIVRFDVSNNTAERFADTFEFIDLTIGLDGLLYALQGDSGSSGRTVNVYDPLTMNLLWTTTLAQEVRGIAVNQNSNIFAASWDGNIYHFGSNGTQLKSIISGGSNLSDIDISFDGKLIIGDRFGRVILTNESLTSVSSFTVGSSEIFVSFSTPQKPNTIKTPTHTVTIANR